MARASSHTCPVQIPRMRPSLVVLITLVIAGTVPGWVGAAPYYGHPFRFLQPDDSEVPVLVWGDEYYQRAESTDGFTLVRDPSSGVICYARLDQATGSLVSTGVRAADRAPASLGLEKHLRETVEVVRSRALAARSAHESRSARDGQVADKAAQTRIATGAIRGITILVDFSDQPATVPAQDFDDFLNLPGYTGYTSNGSVRDYFYEVSGGALTYTNHLEEVYYRALHPKSYYEDPAVDFGILARSLVFEALNWLDARGFDFGDLDADTDGYIDAINIYYAGSPSQGWGSGLWPHSSWLSAVYDGVATRRYQMAPIESGPSLATFCHENGHQLCDWPDLYDYDHDSYGVGRYCLMCNSGTINNPVQPCAPLKVMAGWASSVTLLTSQQTAIQVVAGVNDFYMVPKPGSTSEYYMIENRQPVGRDSSLPDAGLAIWHVDTNGSNNYQQMTTATHYFCTLVQADGEWDLERGMSLGDNTDLWSAPSHKFFSPFTTPAATWWNWTAAPLFVDNVSASAAAMSFDFRPAVGSLAVNMVVEPAGLDAPWSVDGPDGYFATGAGDTTLIVWTAGQYSATWLPMPGWSAPAIPQVAGSVLATGSPLLLSGHYANPPFTPHTVGALGDAGASRGASLVDFDADGDLDIHVCNRGTASRLLRNDGSLSFVDVAAGLVASVGQTMSAVWADYDGDGDQDAYVVRDGQANQLLLNSSSGWVDVAQYGLGDTGAGRAASWVDYDGDGLLDLYLANNSSPSQIFRSFGDIGSGSFFMMPQVIVPLQEAGAVNAAVWADYDRDGDQDLYRVRSWQLNQLVANAGQGSFMVTGASADGGSGQAAAWADVDNDGDDDLWLVNDGQPGRCYRNEESYFAPIEGAAMARARSGRGLAIADFDNDGNLDVYIACNGEADGLLFGDGSGQMLASQVLTLAAGSTTAVAYGDVDGDGGVDLYLSRDGQPNVLMRNTVGNRGHWLQLDLTGTGPNRDAIGAVVRVVAGGKSQRRHVSGGGEGMSQHSRRLAFGLGGQTIADSIVVRWPNGDRSVQVGVTADRVLHIQQGVASAIELPDELPSVTRLFAPSPNPFNPTTKLAFALAAAGPARLAVYGLDGRRVAVLLDGHLDAGTHQATWDGCDGAGRPVASGSYLCRLESATGTVSARMLLLK